MRTAAILRECDPRREQPPGRRVRIEFGGATSRPRSVLEALRNILQADFAVNYVAAAGRVPLLRSGEWMDSYLTLEVDPDALGRLCARYRVIELSVFGSAARGESRPNSDVDLLVVFEEGARVTLFTLFDLQEELSALLQRPVDLVPKDGLKPALRREVLAESRVVYAA
jgi:hypothetical protein